MSAWYQRPQCFKANIPPCHSNLFEATLGHLVPRLLKQWGSMQLQVHLQSCLNSTWYKGVCMLKRNTKPQHCWTSDIPCGKGLRTTLLEFLRASWSIVSIQKHRWDNTRTSSLPAACEVPSLFAFHQHPLSDSMCAYTTSSIFRPERVIADFSSQSNTASYPFHLGVYQNCPLHVSCELGATALEDARYSICTHNRQQHMLN